MTAAKACPRGLCDGSGLLAPPPSTMTHDAGLDDACHCGAKPATPTRRASKQLCMCETLGCAPGEHLPQGCFNAPKPVDSALGLPVDGVATPDAWDLARAKEIAAYAAYYDASDAFAAAERLANKTYATWSVALREREALGPRPAKEQT